MPMKEASIHAAKHRRADVAPRQLRGAGGDHQRQETEDEGKRRHHHRPKAQPRAFCCGFEQMNALLPLLLGKLDDQNAILWPSPISTTMPIWA